MSLDGIVDQCKRYGMIKSEIEMVKALYVLKRDEYASSHVSKRSTALDAIESLREARSYAEKQARAFIMEVIDADQLATRYRVNQA